VGTVNGGAERADPLEWKGGVGSCIGVLWGRILLGILNPKVWQGGVLWDIHVLMACLPACLLAEFCLHSSHTFELLAKRWLII
jgi:hypothetical protein